MKTLKKLSSYLKDCISTHRLNISYLKNDNGKVHFTDGNYAIVLQSKESESLPSLFNVDVKKMIGEVKEELHNGFIVKSPVGVPMDYPSFEPIIALHEKKEKTLTISFSAEYLYNIAQIISKNGTSVTLEITDNMSTIKVTADKENSFGLLMPLKPNWSEK